jgi:hypothetical protein
MKVTHFKFIGEYVDGGQWGVVGGWVGKVSIAKKKKEVRWRLGRK